MKFSTFYKTYYLHRINKANFFLKLIIFLKLPFIYLLNKILYPSEVNLDKFSIKNQNLFNKNLEFLFQYFNSDKGNFLYNQYDKPLKSKKKLIQGHAYHKYYEKFFKPVKQNKLDILEIGSFKGNATAAFYFYFKNSNLITCDIYTDLFLYKSNRIKQLNLNNSSELELNKKIINKNLYFDIIIEDAGHYLKDQIISLFILFKNLKSKGIFVIEELDFPNKREDMNPYNEKPTLKDILQSIIKNENFDSYYITPEDKKYFLNHYDKIDIFNGNFHEIAFITKR